MNTIQVNIDFKQLADIVKQLSPSEKLKLNDIIWTEQIEIPVEQQKLVLSRVRKSKEHPERLLDWDKVSKTL